MHQVAQSYLPTCADCLVGEGGHKELQALGPYWGTSLYSCDTGAGREEVVQFWKLVIG